MNRRGFFGALASLPFIGKAVAAPTRILRMPDPGASPPVRVYTSIVSKPAAGTLRLEALGANGWEPVGMNAWLPAPNDEFVFGVDRTRSPRW